MTRPIEIGDLVRLNDRGKEWWQIAEETFPDPDTVMIYLGEAEDSKAHMKWITCYLINESRYYSRLSIGEIELYEKD